MAREPQRRTASPPADAESDLAREIAKRIESLVPRGQQAQVVAQMVSIVQEEMFQGPMPHPKHFAEYERVFPGCAERLLQMCEQNLAHQRDLQTKAMQADIDDTKAGRRFGFAALVLLILGAGVSIYMDNTGGAALFLGTAALGAVGKFIDGKLRQRS